MHANTNITQEMVTKAPEIIPTDQPGLELVQMLGVEDDEKVMTFQERQREHIAEFGNTIFTSTEEVTKNRIDRKAQRFWVRKYGVDIGWEDIAPTDDGKSATIGIIIAKESSGHGYGTSAVIALTHRFSNEYESIIGEARADHDASIAVLEKAGYIKVEENAQKDWAGDIGATVLKYTK